MSRERYTHGPHGSVFASHARRTAAESASDLKPLLEPGSITLDLTGMVGDRLASVGAPSRRPFFAFLHGEVVG